MRLSDFSKGTHIPSVGQCVGCKYRYFDCSILDFTKMPIRKTIDDFQKKVIVFCESYDGKDK